MVSSFCCREDICAITSNRIYREIYNSSYEEVNRYGNDSDADGMVRGLYGTVHSGERSSFDMVGYTYLWREDLLQLC